MMSVHGCENVPGGAVGSVPTADVLSWRCCSVPDARERVQMFPPGSGCGRAICSPGSCCVCPVRGTQGGLGAGSGEGGCCWSQGGGDRSATARGDRDGGSGRERQKQTQRSFCWEHFLGEGITG